MALKSKMKDLIKSSHPANAPFLEKNPQNFNKNIFKAYRYFCNVLFYNYNLPQSVSWMKQAKPHEPILTANTFPETVEKLN